MLDVVGAAVFASDVISVNGLDALTSTALESLADTALDVLRDPEVARSAWVEFGRAGG